VNGRLLSLPTLRENAEKGDAIAQYKLGSSYLSGSGGVQQDYAEAANWFKLAAVQGLTAAQFDLGYLYQEGKGVAKDYVASASYYRAAAEQGYPTAQNNLASLYEHGWGVPKNPSEAISWYRAAAEHGDPAAQCNLATTYLLGRASEGMIGKRQHGFSQLRSQVSLWPRPIWHSCTTPAEVLAETMRRPQSGQCERQSTDTLSRKRTLAIFTNRERVFLSTTSPLTNSTALEWQEEMTAALRE